jgi:hypothetical protein
MAKQSALNRLSSEAPFNGVTAAGVAFLMATGGGAAVLAKSISGAHEKAQKAEATAMREAPVYAGRIVLEEGARLREFPRAKSDITNTVREGNKLILDHPQIVKTEEGVFAGTLSPDKTQSEFRTPEDRASATNWANVSALVDQGYAEVYPDSGEKEVGYTTYSAVVGKAGELVVERVLSRSDNFDHPGTSVEVNAQAFEQMTKQFSLPEGQTPISSKVE